MPRRPFNPGLHRGDESANVLPPLVVSAWVPETPALGHIGALAANQPVSIHGQQKAEKNSFERAATRCRRAEPS
jgi:hypothetical protein